MDGVDNERCSSRRRLNDDNHGNSCSYNAQIGARELEGVEFSSSGSNSRSEDADSPNNVALDAPEDCQAGRAESRVDDHEVGNTTATPISSSDDQSSGMKRNKGNCRSMKVKQNANKMQWPKWTVTHLLSLSTMENVMNYYRTLKLADNLSDKDLRCFLEQQLLKEKAGLSEMAIKDRLKTKLHDSAAADESGCSICMGEYKEQDETASLYYCSHVYHADCIEKWLSNNNQCPMCRALAIIPEEYPSWNGDVRLHQAFFVHLQNTT